MQVLPFDSSVTGAGQTDECLVTALSSSEVTRKKHEADDDAADHIRPGERGSAGLRIGRYRGADAVGGPPKYSATSAAMTASDAAIRSPVIR